MTVAGHYNCMLEFIVNGFLYFDGFRWLSGITLSLACKANHLLVDQLEAIVDWKILTDVVDDQIDTTLENPRGSEETGPGLNSIVENFGLGRHEETRISSDLAQFRISHLGLDDRVDEAESEGVLLHFHRV